MTKALWAENKLNDYNSNRFDKTEYTNSHIIKADFLADDIKRLLSNMLEYHYYNPTDRGTLVDCLNEIREDSNEIEKLIKDATDY